MKGLKVFVWAAMGLIAGAGLIFLAIRYMDKMIDFIDSIKKRVFFKLEICCPSESDKISEAAAEDYCESFRAKYAADPDQTGEPQPNTPTEE